VVTGRTDEAAPAPTPGGTPGRAARPKPVGMLTQGSLRVEEVGMGDTEPTGGNRTPRRKKNRKATYRLKKKPNK
jgi:hypothetical protein